MKSNQSKASKSASSPTEIVSISKNRSSLSPTVVGDNSDKRKWPPTPTLPITIASTPKSSTRHHQNYGRHRAENSMSDNSLPSSYSSAVSASTNNQALASMSSSLTSQLDENSFGNFTQNSNDADDDFYIAMRNEVTAAVDYLTYLLMKANFEVELTELFRQSLTDLLLDHYSGHWYPDEPLRGSGYRCLRVNGVMHPILANAADLCSLEVGKFRRAFPAEFTIWIDPGNVNVRIGEDGSIGAFSKTDLNASRSTSPCLFSGTTTPSTTATNCGNGGSYSTPGGRKSVPVTTSQRRMSANRTRLFQQQQTTAQQASFLKDMPSPKFITKNMLAKMSQFGSVDHRQSPSPVVGADAAFNRRTEDYSESLNCSETAASLLLSRHFSSSNKIDLNNGVSTANDYELCGNVHLGNASSQRITVNA